MTELVVPTPDPALGLPDPGDSFTDGLSPRARNFHNAPEVEALVARGARYLSAGVPLHLCGAAGIGKTALAWRIAAQIGRPVSLMTGHEGLTHEDFLGGRIGHSETSVIDKYVQSVRRKESRTRIDWRDAILAQAMEKGHTLIYDEFTRASAEANVALLSVLEEGLLVSTDRANHRSYIRAHGDFRIILTSNPGEYAGVNTAPDALRDRMVTLNLPGYSEATEAAILTAHSGIDPRTARVIVAMVRDLRRQPDLTLLPSMRTALLIARIAQAERSAGRLDDTTLMTIVSDVVSGRDGACTSDHIRRAFEATGPMRGGN